MSYSSTLGVVDDAGAAVVDIDEKSLAEDGVGPGGRNHLAELTLDYDSVFAKSLRQRSVKLSGLPDGRLAVKPDCALGRAPG